MDASTFWWMACASAVLLELLSGTFYLLMLATGLAAAALAAQAGLGGTTPIWVAAGVSGAAVGLLWLIRLLRRRRGAADMTDTRRDVHLDIGEIVDVVSWDAHHHTDVHYRGAQWAATLQAAPNPQSGAQPAPAPGPHRIVALDGNRLVLAPT